MRRHMVRIRRGGSNLRIHARCPKPLLNENRIVVTVNDVVSYTRVLRLLRKYRLKNFAALTLIGKRLVRFRSGDRERQSVQDGCFVVVGISRLHFAHLLLKGLCVRGFILAVLAIDFC